MVAVVGSLPFMAPEVRRVAAATTAATTLFVARRGGPATESLTHKRQLKKNEPYDEKVDQFSFAIVVWTLFCFKCPPPWTGTCRRPAAPHDMLPPAPHAPSILTSFRRRAPRVVCRRRTQATTAAGRRSRSTRRGSSGA